MPFLDADQIRQYASRPLVKVARCDNVKRVAAISILNTLQVYCC